MREYSAQAGLRFQQASMKYATFSARCSWSDASFRRKNTYVPTSQELHTGTFQSYLIDRMQTFVTSVEVLFFMECEVDRDLVRAEMNAMKKELWNLMRCLTVCSQERSTLWTRLDCRMLAHLFALKVPSSKSCWQLLVRNVSRPSDSDVVLSVFYLIRSQWEASILNWFSAKMMCQGVVNAVPPESAHFPSGNS